MRAYYNGINNDQHQKVRQASIYTDKPSEHDRLSRIAAELCELGYGPGDGFGDWQYMEYVFNVEDHDEFRYFMEDWKELRRKIK